MAVDRALADLRRAQDDVQRLEQQLDAARARVTRLSSFLEMVEEYGIAVHSAALTASLSVDLQPQSEIAPDFNRATGGKRGAVIRSVIEFMRGAEQPVKTRDLVAELLRRGIVVNKIPGRAVAELSAYLSRTPELVAQRGKGWRLREQDGNVPVAVASTKISLKSKTWEELIIPDAYGDSSDDDDDDDDASR